MYKQGDIVFLPFPFNDNLAKSKERPAVILSTKSLGNNRFIVAKVTSSLYNDNFSFPLFNRDVDFEMAKPSEVRYNEIFTIDITLIRKKIGRLTTDGLERLLNMAKYNFEKE